MKLQLKKDSILIGEYRTIKTLLWAGVILLLMATMAEFLLPFCFNHKDFIENILLGGAASSFVSFITLYIPFKSKMGKEKCDLNSKAEEVCTRFIEVYSSLIECNANATREFIKKLRNEISSFNRMYKAMDFTSVDFLKKEECILKTIPQIIEDIIELLKTAELCLSQKDDGPNYTQNEMKYLSISVYKVIVECVDEYNVFKVFPEIEPLQATIIASLKNINLFLEMTDKKDNQSRQTIFANKMKGNYINAASKLTELRLERINKEFPEETNENK